jgi:heat shock transcription factor
MASGNKKKKDIDFDMILNEMNQIKMQQLAISHEIASIQGQNQLMWTQSRDLQIQYNNQKDTVEKILGFLASVFSKKQGVGGATVPVPSEGNHFHDSSSNWYNL